jgi:putative transposase
MLQDELIRTQSKSSTDMVSPRRHHSAKDVEAKLRQADEMAANGSTQKEISQALGISIMTYHRWRRSRTGDRTAGDHKAENVQQPPRAPFVAPSNELLALSVENERLRRLVTDLLLEKISLQEQLEGRGQSSFRRDS